MAAFPFYNHSLKGKLQEQQRPDEFGDEVALEVDDGAKSVDGEGGERERHRHRPQRRSRFSVVERGKERREGRLPKRMVRRRSCRLGRLIDFRTERDRLALFGRGGEKTAKERRQTASPPTDGSPHLRSHLKSFRRPRPNLLLPTIRLGRGPLSPLLPPLNDRETTPPLRAMPSPLSPSFPL